MALIQLIYVSSLNQDISESEIATILESSIRHNRQNDITGMLLYSNGNFLQVLEGEELMVKETYARIHVDPRHCDIIEIFCEPVDERHFSQWSMGFQHLGKDDLANFPDAAPFFNYQVYGEEINARPGIALDVLLQFSAGNH